MRSTPARIERRPKDSGRRVCWVDDDQLTSIIHSRRPVKALHTRQVEEIRRIDIYTRIGVDIGDREE